MSSDGNLSINYAALSNAEQELGGAFTAAKSAIDDLQAKLNQHLSDWDGDARTAYDGVRRDWQKAFEHMALVLQRATHHLGGTRDQMQNTERNNTRIWTN